MSTKKYFWIVILLSSLPFISLFITQDFPHTHDGVVHLARMAAYKKALVDLSVPVRWAGDLNYGYGMPLFNFIYGFPYLLSSLFLFVGMGLVMSFKIVLFLSFLCSGIFMFLFGREFFKDDTKAFLLTIFYQFAPFRFVELMVRGSFGEVYTYTFLPLILFGLTLLFKKNSYSAFVLTSVATALLIFSHNALSLTFFGVCVLYIFFFAKTKKTLIASLLSLLTGVLIASFYWLPAIAEHKYTYGDLFMKDLYKTHFPPLSQFFIPNPLNNTIFQTGGISTDLGFFHVFGLLLTVYFFVKSKLKNVKLIIFSFVLLIVIFFFMQQTSLFFWEFSLSHKNSFSVLAFPPLFFLDWFSGILRQFQFPWRLLGVAVFATSFLSISYFSLSFFKHKKVFILLVFLVVSYTIYYWKPPLGFDKIDEGYYWNFPLNTTYFGETDIIWSEGPQKSYPKQRIQVIGGEATITNFTKKNQIHTFTLDAKKPSQLVDRTQYFPGWRVYVDDKKVPIEYQDINWRGLITFNVPQGNHSVRVAFEESPIRFIANIISLMTIAFLIIAKVTPLPKILAWRKK